MTQRQLVSLLNYKEPIDHWSEINGLLNFSAHIPSMLQLQQMSLVNSLQYFVDNQTKTDNDSTDSESLNDSSIE